MHDTKPAIRLKLHGSQSQTTSWTYDGPRQIGCVLDRVNPAKRSVVSLAEDANKQTDREMIALEPEEYNKPGNNTKALKRHVT